MKEPVSIRDVLDNSDNVAEILADEDLAAIGARVKEGYDADELSRGGWVQQQEEMLKLTLQVYEKKNTPWPNAANVKYPLLTLAAIRFAATAYPALVDSVSPVKFLVKGEDQDGKKEKRAIRLAAHMSYQLTEEMENWEEEMDKALLITSIHGCAFKKTYRDEVEGKNCSELVLPRDLVVDYWTKDLKTSMRYTHILPVDDNFIYEQVAAGAFLDVDLPDEVSRKATEHNNRLNAHASGQTTDAGPAQSNTPRMLLEQYTYIDLDNDGYKEPYIVTVDHDSAQVLRIVPRFDKDTVFVSPKDHSKILRIEAEEIFTKIPFIPNPDGSFYDIGFGVLLGSLNKAANTILNMLLDAGTLSNRQSGFLSKGIRVKGGDMRFQPGEWKIIESLAGDIKNAIVPLPVREPSSVLYQLLVFLLEAGNRLGSTVDLMVGENPGQNQPYSTTVAVLEQGLKVFVAIHKRQFKAMKSEYQKLYRLNKRHTTEAEYLSVVDPAKEDLEDAKLDYKGEDNDIRPNADASTITEAQRIAKSQALLQLAGPLGLNLEEVRRRVLVSQKQENVDALLQPNPPMPPDPKVELEMGKLRFQAAKAGAELALSHMEIENEAIKDATAAMLNLANARKVTAETNSIDSATNINEVAAHFNLLKGAMEREEAEEQAEVNQQLGGAAGDQGTQQES